MSQEPTKFIFARDFSVPLLGGIKERLILWNLTPSTKVLFEYEKHKDLLLNKCNAKDKTDITSEELKAVVLALAICNISYTFTTFKRLLKNLNTPESWLIEDSLFNKGIRSELTGEPVQISFEPTLNEMLKGFEDHPLSEVKIRTIARTLLEAYEAIEEKRFTEYLQEQ